MKRLLSLFALFWFCAPAQAQFTYSFPCQTPTAGIYCATAPNTATFPGSGMTVQVTSQIDVYLIGGQSNALGAGTGTYPTVPTGKVLQVNGASITDANNPVGTGINAGNGSWPAFGLAYYNATGRKIAFVQKAVGGSTQVAAADTGNGNWDASGALYTSAVNALDTALTTLTAAGYVPTFKGVIWLQGESDAEQIDLSIINGSQYISAFQAMLTRFRTHYGTNMPFYLIRLGNNESGSSLTGWTTVRDAQDAQTIADPYMFACYRGSWEYTKANGLLDSGGIHYTPDGQNLMGYNCASSIVAGLKNSWQAYDGSPITSPVTWSSVPVGILTATPAASLHVFGLETRLQQNNAFYSLFNTAGTRYGYFQGVSTGLSIAAEAGASNTIGFQTNSINRVTIDTANLTSTLPLVLNGSSSGALTIKPPAAAGTNTLTLPAGTTNFSATGGASQVVQQTSVGGAFTVGQLACGNLSDAAGGCTMSTTGTALSLLGRSANSSGARADIAAVAASDCVYRESGSTLACGTIATNGIAANAVTLAKLATQATNTVLGNATSGSAVPTALAVGTCSTAASALIWTTNSGFGCNTSITANSATTATNATNSAITDDTTTNATMDLVWVTTNTGNLPLKVSSSKLNFNPSTGALTATSFNGNLIQNSVDQSTAWATYTPTITCGAGTSTSAAGYFKKFGKTVFLVVDWTNTGTCSGSISISLPSSTTSTMAQVVFGVNYTSGVNSGAGLNASDTTMAVFVAPTAGQHVVFSGVIQQN